MRDALVAGSLRPWQDFQAAAIAFRKACTYTPTTPNPTAKPPVSLPMLIPRQTQLAQAQAMTCFHLWSRVEPAAGAGLTADALKVYAAKLLKRLGNAYAIHLQGFSIESDRFHLVLHWVPGEAAQWSDEESVRRWRLAHPLRLRDHSAHADEAPPLGDTDPGVEMTMPADPATIRQKLTNLSRFMQQFKQLLSRKVNRAAGRKGPLWKGRFKLAQVKDAAELAGVLAFIDLRQVGRGDGLQPEEAPFTSIHARVGRYAAMYGMNADTLPPPDEAARYGPEVAAPLREGEDPLAEGPGMGLPPPEMPPVEMPPPMMPPVEMPGMGGMGGMSMSGMPMPEMPALAVPLEGSSAGVPDPLPNAGPQAFWLLALREDSPPLQGPAARPGMLSWLSLRQYLKLLDALVAQAKAWPHLPGDAPGRAPAPETPPWDGAVDGLLADLGLAARAFKAQWRRLATLRG